MYWEVIIDALIETAWILPVLFGVHFIIEIMEVKAMPRLRRNKVLKGAAAPLIGTGVGLLPQCGFSIVASNMYSKRYIRIGTLVAVFIATSDEALLIMMGEAFTNSSAWIPMLELMAIKIAMALAAGFALNFIFRGRELVMSQSIIEDETYGCCGHAVEGYPKECDQNSAHNIKNGANCSSAHAHSHCHTHGAERDHDRVNDNAHRSHADSGEFCKGGESKARHIWHTYIKHPVIHTLTIGAFILGVNLIMGTIIYFVGEERLAVFMEAGKWLQPLFAALVGLIPNCAASVVIAEMFISGSLTLGAAVSGLAVNAGLGYLILFKQNKNLKENLLIVMGIFIFALTVGYVVSVFA